MHIMLLLILCNILKQYDRKIKFQINLLFGLGRVIICWIFNTSKINNHVN